MRVGRFQEADPVQIRRIPPVGHPTDVADMKCPVIKIADEAVEGSCQYWRRAIVKEDIHAAIRALGVFSSNSNASRTADSETS